MLNYIFLCRHCQKQILLSEQEAEEHDLGKSFGACFVPRFFEKFKICFSDTAYYSEIYGFCYKIVFCKFCMLNKKIIKVGILVVSVGTLHQHLLDCLLLKKSSVDYQKLDVVSSSEDISTLMEELTKLSKYMFRRIQKVEQIKEKLLILAKKQEK